MRPSRSVWIRTSSCDLMLILLPRHQDSFSRSIQGRFDDDDPFIGSGFRREPAIVPSSESDILADDSYHIEVVLADRSATYFRLTEMYSTSPI